MDKILQAHFSQSVKFFENDFLKRWNIKPYSNPNAPAIFLGVCRPEDVTVINNHKDFKLVCNTGKLRDIFHLINSENVVVTATMGGLADDERFNLEPTYQYKEASFEIKDFSPFLPNPLGPKVYCYLGNESGKHVMGYEVAMEVKERIPFEMIIGMQGKSMNYVKENYYDQCFVNLKPSITGGLTTACELAHMGRFTISNSKAPFCKGWETVDDIVNIINQECFKINSIQPSIIGNFFNVDKKWKEVSFWL